MNHTKTSLVAALVTLGALSPVLAANLKDKVNVEIESVKFHADMDPGMYMCAAQHLHIRAALENRAALMWGCRKGVISAPPLSRDHDAAALR